MEDEEFKEMMNGLSEKIGDQIQDSHETLSLEISGVKETLTDHSATVNANIKNLKEQVERVEGHGERRDTVIFDKVEKHETRLSKQEATTAQNVTSIRDNGKAIQTIQAARASSATLETGKTNGNGKRFTMAQIGTALGVAVPIVGGLLYYVIKAVVEALKAS